MYLTSVLVFCIAFQKSLAVDYKFPDYFKFGAASSAYQVEGAWNSSGRGENFWDRLLHTRPEVIVDRTNGDIACDSYRLWRRDIEIAEELGLNMYRFSISWTRILPTGFPNVISEEGKTHYSDFIDGLLAKGIEPLVTIYHNDLPQSLQDLGGWANPLVVDWFVDYAAVVFSLYADRVKLWLTLNEPVGICEFGYHNLGAPFLMDPDVGRYLCNKHTLLAHAKAYRLYEELYKAKYHGKLSVSSLFFWFEPATPDDQEVTDLMIDNWEGRYAHAIFSKEGGWPKKLEKLLLESSIKDGYPQARLPPFTPEEVELIKGTYDFYGLNHYTTRLIHKVKPGEQPGIWPLTGWEDIGVVMLNQPSWKTTSAEWFAIYPKGLRNQLKWIHKTYGVKEIIITENGMLSEDPTLADTERVEYMRDYLEQVILAIEEGVPVTGYTAWTMMNNFEWLSGYTIKYGLYSVDFSDPNRTRTPRESAHFYASVTKSRTLHTLQDNIVDLM